MFLICEIHESDTEAIRETVEIYREAWLCDYKEALGLPEDRLLNDWNAAAEEEECIQWLSLRENGNRMGALMANGGIAGYVAFGKYADEPNTQQFDTELAGLFVRRAYRGLGYGLALLRYAVQESMGAGGRRLSVYNFRRSVSNSFYRSLGGEVVQTVTQTPCGTVQDVDIFSFDMQKLLERLNVKLVEYEIVRA